MVTILLDPMKNQILARRTVRHSRALPPKSLLVPPQTTITVPLQARIVPQRKYLARCHWIAVWGLRPPKYLSSPYNSWKFSLFLRRRPFLCIFFWLHPRSRENSRIFRGKELWFTFSISKEKSFCDPTKIVYAPQSHYSGAPPDQITTSALLTKCRDHLANFASN